MDALNRTLLLDYYGDILTERQRVCFDLRYNHDLSLGEIAQELQVSRQGINDNLRRAEALLMTMEEKTGFVRRDLQCRKAAQEILALSEQLAANDDPHISSLARQIADCARCLED